LATVAENDASAVVVSYCDVSIGVTGNEEWYDDEDEEQRHQHLP
jgi:hypothetical protein